MAHKDNYRGFVIEYSGADDRGYKVYHRDNFIAEVDSYDDALDMIDELIERNTLMLELAEEYT